MKFWYASSYSLPAILLFPFSFIFRCVVALRYYFYRVGFKKTHYFKVPIIIVGNMTVGGTGKTPLVIWLANFLKNSGFSPGIVSRGCGGKRHLKPYLVKSNSLVKDVGDEAILLAQKTDCPLVLCCNRVLAVKTLLEKNDCDIVISDDGLQHYALGRNVEIAVVDGERKFGNGFLLPAGPLREPVGRLQRVDFVVENKSFYVEENSELESRVPVSASMYLTGDECISLKNKTQKVSLNTFTSKKVHAVAGIGNPERFFKSLAHFGIEIIPHIFPDHYLYQAHDFNFKDALPILMTEKDAVKCGNFADNRFWYVPVSAIIDPQFSNKLLGVLKKCEQF